MRYSIFKKLLKKYDSGTSTRAERYIVDVWYHSFDEDPPESIPGTRDPQEAEQTRQRILGRTATYRQQADTVSRFRRSRIQIAASLILISSLSLLFYLNHQESESRDGLQHEQVYLTRQKEIKRILLKDKTIIVLNANSKLSLMKGFGKTDRRVRLTGEAHFEVSRDTTRPFIIDAAELNVRVLGTVFNVQAYDRLNDMKVSVNSGKVQVSNKGRQLALLTKGLELIYQRRSGEFEVNNVVPEQIAGWTEGHIVLEKASFEELAQTIRNLYGTELSTEDVRVKSFKYNVTLRSGQPEKEAMEMLMMILNKKYIKEGKNEIKIY